jgi:Glu-tRNA(Gln) amidotransferase subunit E-like FAD-binding protein
MPKLPRNRRAARMPVAELRALLLQLRRLVKNDVRRQREQQTIVDTLRRREKATSVRLQRLRRVLARCERKLAAAQLRQHAALSASGMNAQQLATELNHSVRDLEARLSARIDTLLADKADRRALASELSEFAQQLTGSIAARSLPA